MDTETLLDELLDLAGQLGIELRREYLGGHGGGICKLRGKWVLFVDTAASEVEQLDQTAAALANREELEQIYLRPQIREILDQYSERLPEAESEDN